jgi:disulfide bond formation protein DsbB
VPAEKRAGAVAALLAALALAIAWVAEHQLLMAPCALCLLERWPYRVLLVLGVAAVAARGRLSRLMLLTCALPLAASIGLSLAHVGVEQGWWPDPLPECVAPRFHGGTMAERLASMPLRPAKPCDTPNRLIAFLPVSMASLDLIYAPVASVLIVLAAKRRLS